MSCWLEAWRALLGGLSPRGGLEVVSGVSWAEAHLDPHLHFMPDPGPTDGCMGFLFFSDLGKEEGAVQMEAGTGPGNAPAQGSPGWRQNSRNGRDLASGF